MTYEFKDYPTVTVAGKRYYKLSEDCLYPSVTSVLGETVAPEKKASLEAWRNSLGAAKADKETKRCGDRGTMLHLMLEQYLKGEEINVPGASHVEWAMFNGMKPKLRKIDEVIGQEVVLYSHGLEIAGRCDLIARYNGELCIVDFKTSTNIKDDKKIEDYKYQLCAYSVCFQEMFNEDIKTGVILMGVENAFPLEFKVPLDPYIPKLFHRVENFYATLKI
jgi:genome maintenance exonuclease 1